MTTYAIRQTRYWYGSPNTTEWYLGDCTRVIRFLTRAAARYEISHNIETLHWYERGALEHNESGRPTYRVVVVGGSKQARI